MSRAISTANLPTLVPPNFWTSQRASGSVAFWCRFGGVGDNGERRFIVEREEWEVNHFT